MPNCVPIIPAVPEDAFYPVSKLNVVPSFDRAAYKAAFGEDAPTYDGSRKTKTWFDSTAIQNAGSPDAQVSYLFIERDASGSVAPKWMSMTAREAASINLYGIHSYPAYHVAPTGAAFTRGGTGVNPVHLCMYADAVALAEKLGLSASAVAESGLEITYPPSELRRMWLITWGGSQLTAGTMLFEQNQNGAGAPGHWNLDGGEPNWISDLPSSLPPQNPAWGIPCRPLADNEAVATNLFGFMIYRKDKPSVYNPAPVQPPAQVISTVAPSIPAAAAQTASPSFQSQFLASLEQSLITMLKTALLQALSQQK